MQQVQDFQTPATQPAQETHFQDEWTPRYGILVGGVKEIPWNGIGEESVGHHLITRRVWMPFIRLQVGRRNEFEGALDLPLNAIQRDWAQNGERVVAKSPRACAQDVLSLHKAQGYCVPSVLIGHPDAQGLTEKVWPRAIRDSKRLFEHIAYFEAFQTDDEDEATLVAQLLEACYSCSGYISEYVRMIKTEVNSKLGLKNLNSQLEELFHEINEPLPEQKTALVASAMGREIVEGVKSDGRKDDAIIGALNAITSRLEKIESGTPLAQGSNPELKEATEDSETSNASTRRRADGGPDRRYK